MSFADVVDVMLVSDVKRVFKRGQCLPGRKASEAVALAKARQTTVVAQGNAARSGNATSRSDLGRDDD